MAGARNLKMWLTICSLMLVVVSAAPADTHYVAPGQSIQDAINAADPGDQIEVAPGTYNEAINFNGKAIRLYSSGGPAATTIDAIGLNSTVVTCNSGEIANTILDGFTITGGNANGSFPHDRGGGMYNDNSSPTVNNCTFTSNNAGDSGGGMYNGFRSNASVTNCTFMNNTAPSGSGIYNNGSSPTITNCSFISNSASAGGGGIANQDSSPTVTCCTFSGNETSNWGGAMNNYRSSPILNNCTFNNNTATLSGGAIFNWSYSYLTVTNCTFTSNTADDGGAIGNYDSRSTVTNCILWGDWPDEVSVASGSTATVTYSNVQGGWPGTGNIDLDPLFQDADGRLPPGSPCIDVGDNSAVGAPTDLDGNPRIVDGNFDGLSVVDMGAYERQCRPLYVPSEYSTIQVAINAALSGYEIEVAPGTYNEAINFLSKAIRLYSSGGRKVTTIDASGLDSTVVTCNSGEGANTILEGFTITGGNADNGGGMYNNNSSPTVTNCIFSNNSANRGGGMRNDSSSPAVTGCTFSGNNAGVHGGGMYNYAGSSPTMTNCTFSNNSSVTNGGGMYSNASSPTLVNCTFTSNTAGYGGGMHNSGSSPALSNCTFMSNAAGYDGGGMYNYTGSSPTLTNCTFSNNSATNKGGAMRNQVSSPILANCIVWGDAPDEIFVYNSTPNVTYCDVQGGWPGTGNIDLDPCFADAAGRLSWNSPCIDAGDNSVVDVLTDRDGKPRFADFTGKVDTGSGTPPIVDIGSYEYPWVDDDGDRIRDDIDKSCGHYSNEFSMGGFSPYGTIATRGQQNFVVFPQGSCTRIASNGSPLLSPACIHVWKFRWSCLCFEVAQTIWLKGYADLLVCPGSIVTTILQGTVEMTFYADDGTEAQTSLSAGNSIEFEPETCVFTAPETNSEPIVIVVDGGEIVLTPGQSKLLANVDIDPETLNLKSEGTGVACYIELPEDYDVHEIKVDTLLLNGQVPAEPEPTQVGDYDSDGKADLMVKFDRAATHATLEVGDVVHISVAGQLNDGTEFEGCDVVRVIAPGQ